MNRFFSFILISMLVLSGCGTTNDTGNIDKKQTSKPENMTNKKTANQEEYVGKPTKPTIKNNILSTGYCNMYVPPNWTFEEDDGSTMLHRNNIIVMFDYYQCDSESVYEKIIRDAAMDSSIVKPKKVEINNIQFDSVKYILNKAINISVIHRAKTYAVAVTILLSATDNPSEAIQMLQSARFDGSMPESLPLLDKNLFDKLVPKVTNDNATTGALDIENWQRKITSNGVKYLLPSGWKDSFENDYPYFYIRLVPGKDFSFDDMDSNPVGSNCEITFWKSALSGKSSDTFENFIANFIVEEKNILRSKFKGENLNFEEPEVIGIDDKEYIHQTYKINDVTCDFFYWRQAIYSKDIFRVVFKNVDVDTQDEILKSISYDD